MSIKKARVRVPAAPDFGAIIQVVLLQAVSKWHVQEDLERWEPRSKRGFLCILGVGMKPLELRIHLTSSIKISGCPFDTSRVLRRMASVGTYIYMSGRRVRKSLYYIPVSSDAT